MFFVVLNIFYHDKIYARSIDLTSLNCARKEFLQPMNLFFVNSSDTATVSEKTSKANL